ncbi:MAG: RidA family protein [Clostridia bacterium]|nr:RidA family protein [Clostridia bacterium]MBR0444938.1 RidA family protein [Clostridia bacterium]
MKKAVVHTSIAPTAIGPYSQGIIAGDLVFVSGQLPVDMATGSFPEGISAQTRQSLLNLQAILKEAGTNLGNIVKTTVFLSDMNNFAAMNEVYRELIGSEACPARSAVEVARLPKDALVEIEAIAVK